MDLKTDNLKDIDSNEFIKEHIPFIIKTINEITGRYICLDNDEEISIGLLAFNEARQKYDYSKGHFLPYAKLVIKSRILNYLRKEKNNNLKESLEKLREDGFDFSQELYNPIENQDILIQEMNILKTTIQDFGFELDDLVEESPKHKDTRNRAIDLSNKINDDNKIKESMYTKRRLPIKEISIKYVISQKIIKGSKKFIITVVIVLDKNLRNLKLWVRK
ncbi:RNA polymerase sigma factor SigI [[Clostridium] sordellii]|uniref:RNA polymerase sigma factor SigI n=1 Tax=Paraclostridium sordellii TaxID=1505 RepID=A0ABM9RRL0_PARSO|nr:sigma-70 family RNA polymerase sigma factor [Paeniclostridium sordellii]EPZ60001.1 RNA polymerase sigma factor, sigma-70 family protein [[Clostridium] sordellii ATCC 9714] [Paeniclostridium sordellii ATCC 9714]CEJ74694.1 sigma factor SgiI [[Clostridium] sordellii] [Paeniclostridium sordellii]CEN70267.1 RNA polymerase sigma factor SigI [[Clostridium] sordellii] [Paeniclostridium sordellii]CEN73557.1 RNA polymerase sigma factor SigI [[Clostridium] sordellii] [Paeniclostridium sordellii]CEO278